MGKELKIKIGKSVHWNCYAHGMPPPVITWFKVRNRIHYAIIIIEKMCNYLFYAHSFFLIIYFNVMTRNLLIIIMFGFSFFF